MTVPINFLPRSYQPPRKLGARDYLLVGAAAMALLAGAAYYTNAYADLNATEAKIKSTEQEIAIVKARAATVESVRAREERVAQAEMEIKSLKGRAWSPVLLGFRDLTPQRMYWTDFKVEQGIVTISGSSESLMDIAQFIVGLMVSPSVMQVDLQAATASGETISASVKQGEKVPAALAEPADCTRCRLTFTLLINLTPPGEGGQT